MKRYVSSAVVLVVGVLFMSAVSGVAQPADEKATLQSELQVGKRYHFVPLGKDYSDQGALVEVIAIDKQWVKVKTGLVEARYVWINLQHVGAIKTTEKVKDGKPVDKDK